MPTQTGEVSRKSFLGTVACNRTLSAGFSMKKKLFSQRRQVGDGCLTLAVMGLILMVVDNELIDSHWYEQISNTSCTVRTLISLSTFLLLVLLVIYHVIELKIDSIDDNIDDWRLLITSHRLVGITVELLVCLLHPPPVKWWRKESRCGVSAGSDWIITIVSLGMFLRIYLMFRVILLHSTLFSDAGFRSLSMMNKFKVNTYFVIKTQMTQTPVLLLLMCIVSTWILLSWCMRVCESSEEDDHLNLLNAFWLIAVTSLSIGYGDLTPNTTCSRIISISAGVFGSCCAALFVAFFARKLELSPAEKHVMHFMLENSLSKQLKHFAANVLRETWLIYKYTKLMQHQDPARIRYHQRKFIVAIDGLRKMRVKERKLAESTHTVIDLNEHIHTSLVKQASAYISTPLGIYRETECNILDSVADVKQIHKSMQDRLARIENELTTMKKQMANLPVEIIQSVRQVLSNSNCCQLYKM